MKELTDKLAAIGAPISEDQVVTLLGSLPSDYSTLVTALEARADDLTLEQALIHEERKKSERYKLSDTVTTVEQKALMGRQTRQLRCYGCGEIGHYRRECPKRKSPHNAKSAEVKHSDTDTEYAGAFAMSVKFSDKAARWLVDSRASSHMTHRREILTYYKNPEKVSLGDGRFVDAVGVGNVHLKMLFKVSEPKKSVMYEVLYVPKLACNLFSAASKGNIVKFGKVRCWIRDSKGILRGMGSLMDKLYQLDCESIIHEQASVTSDISSADLWHQRLGHISGQRLKEMVSNEMVTGVKIPVSAAEFSFVRAALKEKCNGNHSNQWERFALQESCSVSIVMFVDLCLLSQLERESTL